MFSPRMFILFLSIAVLATNVAAHAVVTEIQGANGVVMPGLTIQDGTPRDCSSNRCGSQADTAIIRNREIRSGRATPLGRTQGNGPVNATVMVAAFMGAGAAPPSNQGEAASVGVEDDIGSRDIRQLGQRRRRQLRDSLFGGGRGGRKGDTVTAKGAKVEGPPEARVAAAQGVGAREGLPTCGEDGVVRVTVRQINQDGAGPFTADIDSISGGTTESAMQPATVIQDVPGLGFGGLSRATNTEFEMQVRMPQGMTCEAMVAGTPNVCVMRVRNKAAAGPFGGSVAFTQSATARKRAVAWRVRKRMEVERGGMA